MQLSEKMVKTIPFQVNTPTLIFQGSADPLFQEDHGKALSQAIKGSKYVCIAGMGHLPTSPFYDVLYQSQEISSYLSA